MLEKLKEYEKKYKLQSKVENILFYIAVLIFFVSIYDIGFLGDVEGARIIDNFYYAYLLIYFVCFSIRIPALFKKRGNLYLFIVKLLLFIFLAVYFFNLKFLIDAVDYHGVFYRFVMSRKFVYMLIAITFFIEVSKNTYKIFRFNITPEILFAVSFFVLIMIGAGLLMIPNATYSRIQFVDSLFIAASATSITGLQCIDTAASFTPLGQLIILLLAQIGGLGVMTFTSFIVYFFKDTSSFKAGLVLGDMMSNDRLGDAFKTIMQIVIYTFSIEAMGAVCIFLSIRNTVGFGSSADIIWFSVYNSITAFCNAGFTTIPGSMTSQIVFNNYSLKVIISLLAVLGGIGFPILSNLQAMILMQFNNIKNVIFNRKKYQHIPRLINVNTKLATLVSSCLFVFGTVAFLLLEYNNSLSVHDGFFAKFIDSFYYSVMPRSAGFNDVDINMFRLPTIMIIMFLMWVGASPISTGGGIKTTTFGVALLDIISILQGKDRLEIYRRKIANSTVRHAFAVIMISFAILCIGVFLLSIFEENNDNVNILTLSFECISAYCTCGLSMGASVELSSASKILISFLMYVGRIGALTLAAAFFTKPKTLRYMYPKEKVYIG